MSSSSNDDADVFPMMLSPSSTMRSSPPLRSLSMVLGMLVKRPAGG